LITLPTIIKEGAVAKPRKWLAIVLFLWDIGIAVQIRNKDEKKISLFFRHSLKKSIPKKAL